MAMYGIVRTTECSKWNMMRQKSSNLEKGRVWDKTRRTKMAKRSVMERFFRSKRSGDTIGNRLIYTNNKFNY